MAANRAGRAGSRGLQRRPARVTVRYNPRELRRRLDTERWIDGRLQELYRGREAAVPAELSVDALLELPSDEERAQELRVLLQSCTRDTQGFIRELLAQLKGLQNQRVLQEQPPPGPPHA